jgi:epoxyqueuosine reductase
MILLHVCCADCGLKMLDAIKTDPKNIDEEIHLFYYNPNIHPQSEFTARQLALQKIAETQKLQVIIANWTPTDYFGVMQDLKEEVWKKELRCVRCWRLRMARTFAYAQTHGYAKVSTTLLTSKYMQKGVIMEIGCELSKDTGIEFYSPETINPEYKTKGFYKQNFCGCVFSLKERMQEKYGSIDGQH